MHRPIREGGEAFKRTLCSECLAVADAAGEPVPDDAQAKALATLTQAGSPITSSMLRDLLAGQATGGAHIVDDMRRRARLAHLTTPLLDTAWVHLQAYDAGLDMPVST